MSLRSQIDEQMKQAMRDKNEVELGLFRMIKSSIKNTEIAKGHELDDEEVLAVLEKEAKQRKDSISQFESGGRADLAEGEKVELAIIEKYLPEKMGDDEIRKAVREVIKNNDGADFGKIMGMAMGQLKGKADGSDVQRIVKEELGA